ncbi:MAG TPA: adenylosuccinate synthase [Candidatus Cloacimonas sp.]|jgi:adenylosuccinate synthase|nr:adenylosuccinate synthase [Candidatus Cloacimonas sp.]
MSSLAVLGCMWGDEAKAKIVDFLGETADVVVRFQGGANAGHTIVVDGIKYVFHSVPSGMLYPDVKCVIGSGVIVDPRGIKAEIEKLMEAGIDFSGRLFIDERAAMVLSIHKELDLTSEQRLGKAKIGTTGRGIGPAYADRVARRAIRLVDLRFPTWLRERIIALYAHHHLHIRDAELDTEISELIELYDFLKPFMCQTDDLLWDWYSQGQRFLFEGAQGTLLDLVYGSYPYVTSSHTMSGGISIGTGLPPHCIDKIIGVYKAYCTRVGEGPMPTELTDEVGDYIRKAGNEFGSTTGRPRRIGWFDAVAARYTSRINGIHSFALTLLDVLSGIETLKICTSYWLDGERLKGYPSHHLDLARVQCEYLELPGWEDDITGCTKLEHLPKVAIEYLEAVQDLVEKPLQIVSVGKERKQTIVI